jgi:hypothetical protein
MNATEMGHVSLENAFAIVLLKGLIVVKKFAQIIALETDIVI